jgi:choline dehydrogenase-like flavoprotein
LLLSTGARYPDGIGNGGGHVGQHLMFHHLWLGTLLYTQAVFAGSVGPVTGQTHHFCNPASRGTHGGVKVEFSSHFDGWFPLPQQPASGEEILEALRRKRDGRGVVLHGESTPDPGKHVRLSAERDRFGDPFAHIQYKSSQFDYETHRFARTIFDQFRDLTEAESGTMTAVEGFYSGSHHMGTCRMGSSAKSSVVDSFGRVHDTSNLYVAGSSVFVGGSGSVNPTLTLVALAIRTASRLLAG